MLKAFIEIIDNLKEKLNQKTDVVIDGYKKRFLLHNEGVEKICDRATDQMRRLEDENTIWMKNAEATDQLTHDINLLKYKRVSNERSEAILTKVKQEIDNEKLEDRIEEFELMASGKTPIYDEREADEVYRKIAQDLAESVRKHPSHDLNDLVKAPYEHSIGQTSGKNISRIQSSDISMGMQTKKSLLSSPNGAMEKAALQDLEPTIISQGRMLITPHSQTTQGQMLASLEPKMTLKSTLKTYHDNDINCLLSLNQRYFVTASEDKSLHVYDLLKPNKPPALTVKNVFRYPVTFLRKIAVKSNSEENKEAQGSLANKKQAHPLGNYLITASTSSIVSDLNLFDLTSSSPTSPVASLTIQETLISLEPLSESKVLVLTSAAIHVLHLHTLSLVSTLKIKFNPLAGLWNPQNGCLVVSSQKYLSVYRYTPGAESFTLSNKVQSPLQGSPGVTVLSAIDQNLFLASHSSGGVVIAYRYLDLQSVASIRGQPGGLFREGLVFNFVGSEVCFMAINDARPFFSFCGLDDASLSELKVSPLLYSPAKGSPAIQISESKAGSIGLLTLNNQKHSVPGVNLYQLQVG